LKMETNMPYKAVIATHYSIKFNWLVLMLGRVRHWRGKLRRNVMAMIPPAQTIPVQGRTLSSPVKWDC
jgi:hypothetical protein